jgi:MoaA/NifB/PqqE/SkfB family radical SAM enzyme
MQRKKGVMDFKLYKRIIDECADYDVRRLQLNNIGEPLMDPLIMKRIGYAKKNGLRGIRIFTNASLLDQKRAKEIFTSGLDLLIISLDGVTKDAYEGVRRGLNFDVVVKNIKEFLEMKKCEEIDKPKVELHMTVLNKNNSQTEKFIKEYKNLADAVTVTIAHDWAGQTNTGEEYIKESKKIRRRPCRRLWFDFNIFWNGLVPLCCLDYEGKIILGNVNEEKIYDIWNGERFKIVREAHLKNQIDKISLCRTCKERVSWWRSDDQ